MVTIRTILHPTDFSERSGYAFELACSLARDLGARLIVLHVVHTSLAVEKRSFGEDLAEDLNRMKVPNLTPPVERRLKEGDPATEICRVAKETGCEMIAMGTHGRTGIGRLLMGSVVEQVVRKAPCPVLAVKAPFAKLDSC
jgi:nucleotide-binding universal stress UspA family protein